MTRKPQTVHGAGCGTCVSLGTLRRARARHLAAHRGLDRRRLLRRRLRLGRHAVVCVFVAGTKPLKAVHKRAERLPLLPRQRQRNPARPGRAFTVAFHGCVGTPASMASAGESPGGGGFKHGVACAGAAVFTKLRHRRCLFAHGVEAGASFASVSRRRGATRDRHRKLSPPANPVQQRPCS